MLRCMALTAKHDRRIHPGSGRRRGRDHAEGPAGRAGGAGRGAGAARRPRAARDLLIEHLHLLQDHYGCLHARHLAALAEEMRLALAEVYEVASFYAHFDIVMDDEAPPPRAHRAGLRQPDLRAARRASSCSPSCRQRLGDDGAGGARAVHGRLRQGAGRRGRPCAASSTRPPTASPTRSRAEATRIRTSRPIVGLDDYRAGGGYRCSRRASPGARTRESVIEALDKSGTPRDGRRRASRPGANGASCCAEPGPRLMAVNGDEGEPGTFKDRYFLETDPHRFLEGHADRRLGVEAADIYIYLRDEYPQCRELLRAGDRRSSRPPGSPSARRIHLRRGAGAYICGEESAMLESIEGKRGLPRHKPPFPVAGRPVRPADADQQRRDAVLGARHRRAGAGLVRRPGPQRPQGPAQLLGLGPGQEPRRQARPGRHHRARADRRILRRHGGRATSSRAICRAAPRAASCRRRWPTSRSISARSKPQGCFIGSAAVVVLSDKDDMKAVALNLLRFFEDESCGQCTPCRVGTEKAVKLMSAPRWDEPLLEELSRVMGDASICGLGQAATNPVQMVLKHFPEECRPEHVTAQANAFASSVAESRHEPIRSTVHARRRRGRGRAGRDDLAGGATALGIEIPHLCYAPEPGYRADGNCRACMVEIEGERVLAASCIRKPTAGHEGAVGRASARKASRQMVFELLVGDQPERAAAHDPNSSFWQWADRLERRRQPLPRARRSRRPTAAIRRWRSISTPASSAISASAPAARSRSTT